MNAKELCEIYDGRDIALHIMLGNFTEQKMTSIRINKPIDELKYVSVYSFRFEDDCLVMFASAQTTLYNLLINPVKDE